MNNNIYNIYKKIYFVRIFEEKLLDLFSQGKISGTTHTYSGQEAIGYSVISNLYKDDFVFSSHRCHGHFIFKENEPEELLAEIMGKQNKICNGRGGSQHINLNNFYSSGVQGGYLSISAGIAFDLKSNSSKNIIVAFIGDGTFGEGSIYESLNIISLFQLPILIVVENNNYAQSTHISNNLSGSISDRIKSFGIKTNNTKSNDVLEIHDLYKTIINEIRTTRKPQAIVANTNRFNAHSKGDDDRTEKELNEIKQYDPLVYLENKLKKNEINEIQSYEKNKLETMVINVLKRPLAKL